MADETLTTAEITARTAGPSASGQMVQPIFPVEPLRISGSAAIRGIVLLCLVLPAAAGGIGLLAGIISHRFYLVALSPIVMGLAAGAIGRALLARGAAGMPAVLRTATFLTASTAVVGLHFGRYAFELRSLEDSIPGIFSAGIRDPIQFARYVDRNALEGVTLSRLGWPEGKGLNLGYAGSYIYWIAEGTLIGFLVLTTLRSSARSAWCERCRRAKRQRILGQLPSGPADVVARPLYDGDLASLLANLTPSGTEGLVLQAAVCPACRAETTVDIALVEVARNANGHLRTRRFHRVRYPGNVLAFLDVPAGSAESHSGSS